MVISFIVIKLKSDLYVGDPANLSPQEGNETKSIISFSEQQ